MLYGQEPKKNPCTNIWISGNPWEDILKSPSKRGEDIRFYYNCFLRVRGVEDKTTYLNQLLNILHLLYTQASQYHSLHMPKYITSLIHNY